MEWNQIMFDTPFSLLDLDERKWCVKNNFMIMSQHDLSENWTDIELCMIINSTLLEINSWISQ